ncbi:MAG: hypothetical protein SFX73_11840 [Kofleriaceae bacterium]|nr:hypothetical protein [Kofleriaceae bacterium]
MLLVAIMTVPRAQLDAFRAYEHAAAKIMARHRGAIERALVLDEGGETLRELHIVRFPTDDDFTRYRADTELRALANVRASCMLSTEILPACDGPTY